MKLQHYGLTRNFSHNACTQPLFAFIIVVVGGGGAWEGDGGREINVPSGQLAEVLTFTSLQVCLSLLRLGLDIYEYIN